MRNEFVLPPTRVTGAWADLAARLEAYTPRGTGSEGLLEALPMIGNQRSPVFPASDFHFPLALLDALLAGLARHQVVPVVLADSGESEPAPARGRPPRLPAPNSPMVRCARIDPRLLRTHPASTLSIVTAPSRGTGLKMNRAGFSGDHFA